MSLRDNRVYFIVVIVAVFAVLSIAHADETATTMTAPAATAAVSNGSSEAEQKSGFSGFMSHMHASYFATLHGPNLHGMDTPYTVDPTGKPSKQQMYLDSEVNLPYAFNDAVSVSPVIPFFLYPGFGTDTSLGDVGFKVTNKKTITTSNFNLSTNLILQLPTNTLDKARGLDLGIKTTPNVRYVVQNTRFTLGAWTEAKAYLGVTRGKAFKLYAQPYANYQLSHSFSLNVGYEMETDHMKGLGKTFDFKAYQSDLMPGFVYMITPSVMINPYLQIFTANNISTDRMALGAVVSASL